MIYLTYGEPPSGVFYSQVTDVIMYLNKTLDAKIRLVSFISLHDYSKSKAAIKKNAPNAIVLPMLPKAPYWKFNTIILWFLTLFLQPKVIIARNVIAANMALRIRGVSSIKKVCFDGRGAMEAEWNEYDVKVVDSWKRAIGELENNAVNKSNFRIAVTHKLVDHWRARYNFVGDDYVVIPCTLNSSFKAVVPVQEEIIQRKSKLGLAANDIVLAYSGSTSGWQSFAILYEFLSKFLKESASHKVIFLAQEEENISKLIAEFPNQVQRKWVAHQEVTEILTSSDIGILIREQSVTNKVASPTKFAEYLSAGLPVIISENLGDYSEFVVKNNCGVIFNGDAYPKIEATPISTRARMIQLVSENWTKEANINNYKTLLSALK
jgi:hypothetical protein